MSFIWFFFIFFFFFSLNRNGNYWLNWQLASVNLALPRSVFIRLRILEVYFCWPHLLAILIWYYVLARQLRRQDRIMLPSFLISLLESKNKHFYFLKNCCFSFQFYPFFTSVIKLNHRRCSKWIVANQIRVLMCSLYGAKPGMLPVPLD